MRLQHRVLRVAAPVGARHAGQLERAAGSSLPVEARCGPRHRSIQSPSPWPERYMVIGSPSGSSITHSALNASPLLARRTARTCSRGPHFADQRLVGGDDAPHLLLDRRQVLLGERAVLGGRREIVIEAVVGRRAEGDLRAREQLLHRLGEDVREVVADELERVLLVARGDQREARIALERAHDVAHLAVDPRRERGLGEARPDRRGDVGRGRALGHFPHRTVGKRDLEHLGHCRGGI